LLRFGDGVGFWAPIAINGDPQWIGVPTGTTQLGYAVLDAGVISVVEVIGGVSPFGPSALSQLSDVSLSGLTDDQVLSYDSASAKWDAETLPAGLSSPLTTKGDVWGFSSVDARIPVGANNQVLTADSAQPLGLKWATPGASPAVAFSAYLLFQDQKTAGTDGGTFTSGAWRQRDINTKISDVGSHGSVASNQITLDAGTYVCDIMCPAFAVDQNMARLQDVTNSVTLAWGSSSEANHSTSVLSPSWIRGTFTLTGSTTLQIQHRCATTENTNGFGAQVNGNFAVDHETYTQAQFWKV